MIDGRAVRIARIRAGFQTQQEFARAVGCARNTISRAELGRGGTGILQRIADVLQVPPRALMDAPDDEAVETSGPSGINPRNGIPTGSLSEVAPTADEQAALSALRKLRPALRAKAIGYLTGLADGGGAEEAAALGAELAGKLAATEEAEEAEEAQAAARKSKMRDSSA